MKKMSGLQYRTDHAAQGFAPMRGADAYGLKHPAANIVAWVVLIVGMGVLAGFGWHSVWLGIIVAVVVAVVMPLLTKRNHRRRVANGTSAQYGKPH